jgi:hypothetical protein
MPAVVRLRRLMFVMPGWEAGNLGQAAKGDDLQFKSEGRGFPVLARTISIVETMGSDLMQMRMICN